MDKNTKKNKGGFIGYIRRTIRIKLVAIGLATIGLWSMSVSSDATGGVFFMMLAIPFFFIDDKDEY